MKYKIGDLVIININSPIKMNFLGRVVDINEQSSYRYYCVGVVENFRGPTDEEWMTPYVGVKCPEYLK